METIRKIILALHTFFVVLAQILLVAMVIIIFTNVVLRYVFDSGIIWSEEMSLVFVVWFTFISMAIGVRRKLHISINIFPKHMPRWFRAFIRKFDTIPIMLVAGVLIVWGWVLVQFTARSIMPATGLPSNVKYAVIPVAGVLIVFHALFDLFGHGEYGEGAGSRSESEIEGDEEGDDNA